MRTCVDHWVKTEDVGSLTSARDLLRKEGLLVGGSSGSVLVAAKQFIKEKGWENDKTKRVVCVFQDSIRNYITKHLSKEWCVEKEILPYDELKEEGHPLNGIPLSDVKFPEVQAHDDLTVQEAKELFEKGARIIPLRSNNKIEQVILPKKFLELVLLKKLKPTDSALKTRTKDFAIVPDFLDAAQLSKILERHEAVIVEKRNGDKSEKLWAASASDLFCLLK